MINMQMMRIIEYAKNNSKYYGNIIPDDYDEVRDEFVGALIELYNEQSL